MKELSKPSRELAETVLGEVGYEERIEGFKMNPMSGYEQTSIYSLEEVIDFLYMDDLGSLLAKGNAGSMGYMDLPKLQEWVDTVLGDKELAEAIKEELESAESYKDAISPIRELVIHRLMQCKEVLKEPDQSQE